MSEPITEPVVILDTYVSGTGPVEFLQDGNCRVTLIAHQTSCYGQGVERVVVQKAVMSPTTLAAIAEALAVAVKVGPRGMHRHEIASGLN